MGKGDASAAVGRGWGLRALSAKHPVSKAKGPTAARSSCEFFIEGTKSHCECMWVLGCGIRCWMTSEFHQVYRFKL
jgi:hypothetical protein